MLLKLLNPLIVRSLPSIKLQIDSFSVPAAMPDSSFLKLSLFVSGDPADPPAARSPRSFADGAVGLGIVAALSGGGDVGGRGRSAALRRSEPIPIAPTRAFAAARSPEPDETELSESYTCVISHVRGNSVRKRVYFGDGSEVVTGAVHRGRAVLFEMPPPPEPAMPFAAIGFLSRCYLCKKKLEGIDVYMYRIHGFVGKRPLRLLSSGLISLQDNIVSSCLPGDKAFCSAECRCQQMLFDEHKNCGSEVLKSYECSVSPCSGPLLFATGVAAA
ncbi:FCS-Like Zinc finger 14-like [Phoenix dactylifera]|uniref:FCS-Like Zinc finger 14-like n=1 Tax=Phoenix dactylifera TaxID=42345 RepID=A0A8B9AJX6_PHODC|nr:FCS-Like Zinc finger 14-like [Phoenix dactylifera]